MDSSTQGPELIPPPSLERISAFLDEVTHSSAFESMPESGGPQIGLAGIAAQGMANEVLGRASLGGLLPIQKNRNALADKYSIQSRDVREFSQWLVKYRDRQDDSENVVRVTVIDRPVEGPERIVQGPPRDLTRAELEALIARTRGPEVRQPDAATPQTAPSEPQPQTKTASSNPNYKGPTPEESREAVGFLNRGVWGSNLGFGSFAAGMAMGGAPGLDPSGASIYYLARGVTGPPGYGGMAAMHGMPGVPLYGAGMSPYPQGGFGAIGPGGILPTVFDTAPGPMGMGVAASPMSAVAEVLLASRSLTPTPQMGQVTLLAPPVHVASEDSRAAGSAVAFEWSTLARGAAPVDAGTLAGLRNVLPQGTAFVYPAIPMGQLPTGAVNLNLAPALTRQLMATGYGVDDPKVAFQSSTMAVASSGGTPQAMAMAASIVPLAPPIVHNASILGTETYRPQGALGEAGGGQAKRGGALDFLGVPVRLAPTLGATQEVRQERDMRASVGNPSAPHIVHPQQFAPLRNNLFTAFQSVSAEPHKEAWNKAAPSFGLRDSDPATLLSPDSRVKMPSAGAPLPQTSGSSDPLGRSIGLAAKASEAMSEASAARSSADIRAISTTPGSHQTEFLTVNPEFGGSAISKLGQNRGAGFGGSAMANFQPSTSLRPLSSTSAPNFGSSASRPWDQPSHAALPSPAGSPASFPTPSQPGFAFPNTASPVGRSGIPTTSPKHLPMLSTLGARSNPNTYASSSPAMPTMHGAGSTMTPLQPSAMIGAQRSMTPAAPASGSQRAHSTAATPMMKSGLPTSSGYLPPTTQASISMPSSAVSTTAPARPMPSLRDSQVAKTEAKQPSLNLRQPVMLPPASTSSLVTSTPAMSLRFPPTPPPPASSSLAIQASTHQPVTPAGAEGGQNARSESSRSSEVGNAAGEVNLLAREVWSLLKRKIATEAERHGLR